MSIKIRGHAVLDIITPGTGAMGESIVEEGETWDTTEISLVNGVLVFTEEVRLSAHADGIPRVVVHEKPDRASPVLVTFENFGGTSARAGDIVHISPVA